MTNCYAETSITLQVSCLETKVNVLALDEIYDEVYVVPGVFMC
jgi:hypothetical protein